MASTAGSKTGQRIVLSLAVIIVSSTLTVAATPNSKDCIAQLEGSGSYNSRPSPLGHQGKYQMGVQAMQDAGFCALRPGTSAETSNHTQNWQNCILTEKGKQAGIKANSDGTINLNSFQGNGPAQEAAYEAFAQKRRQYGENYDPKGAPCCVNLYEKYRGEVINGVVMTDEVIDYLIHHGGTAGAYRYLVSKGSDCVKDDAVGSSLCKSAQKMNDCMGGKTNNTGDATQCV